MRRLYYHGTSADNLDGILRDGLCPGQKNWQCSDSNHIYLWAADKISALEGEADPEGLLFTMKERASSTASIALAYAKDCRRVILEVELDDADVNPDRSARDMDGAVSVEKNIPPEKITRAWVDPESLAPIQGYFLMCRHETFAGVFPVQLTVETIR